MKKYLSKEEKERRKNKIKGLEIIPPSKRLVNKFYANSTSKKGMIVQFISANTAKSFKTDDNNELVFDKDGKPIEIEIFHAARKVYHDPKAIKYNQFVLDLKRLGATEEYINKVSLTHFGK